jgi:hypothetical protein
MVTGIALFPEQRRRVVRVQMTLQICREAKRLFVRTARRVAIQLFRVFIELVVLKISRIVETLRVAAARFLTAVWPSHWKIKILFDSGAVWVRIQPSMAFRSWR